MTDKAKAVKTPNYTPEMEAEMSAAYMLDPTRATVDALALSMGKSTRSIIAKLVRLGIYRAPVRTSKNGGPIVKKSETADAIGAILRLPEADVTSLTAATKSALAAIFAALANSVPIDPDKVAPAAPKTAPETETGE